jgi:predicted RNA binding protein YcfA (HicA-like mRNA interferase family)
MTQLPVISGRERVAALARAGFTVRRQVGSHIVMRRDSPFPQTVGPDHRVLDRGTLRAIIRQAGLRVDDFVRLLDA